MAYSEQLAARVREALEHIPKLEEKKMFGGMAFLVDGKMCINVSKDRLMCRIDPAIHETVVESEGVESVKMRGRDFIGYVYVDEDAVRTKKDFDYWIRLSLDYNKVAKSSKSGRSGRRSK